MARSRSEAIADAIAARIVRNRTRKHFSRLYADALEEIYMSTPTSGTLNGGSTFTPTQKSGADQSSKGQLAEMSKPRLTGGNTTSGMSTNDHQVPNPTAKPVDFKTLAGSYAGDHRVKPGDVAKESLDKSADNGGPRKSVGQFKSSKFESQPPFQSTPTGLDSDAGN